MSEKTKETCIIMSQIKIASAIYSMWLKTKHIAKTAKPGQFISVYSNDGSRILPRPISICELNREQGAVRIVYRVTGKGTEEFSRLQTGDVLEILGPLGNGFPLEQTKGKNVLLIAGGIGIPPMIETAKQLPGKNTVIALGYRDELFLHGELSGYGEVLIATENGSAGMKGNVLDAIKEQKAEADILFACGPTPMLRAVKAYAGENHVPCWVSVEERMACGIGACLGCVCSSAKVDSHSLVHNKRICKDGPVFLSTEVELS